MAVQVQCRPVRRGAEDKPFLGAHLEWPVARAGRGFVVRVVEPDEIEPGMHGRLFSAVLSHLISPAQQEIALLTDTQSAHASDPFDLLTFPEAFLPVGALLETLSAFTHVGPTGCVHTGLRPGSGNGHLFTTAELADLVRRIEAVATSAVADLLPFRSWLAIQRDDRRFNVGCVFAVDAFENLRVCLQPKCVRSQFETNPLVEKHMEEANLLTVITLYPLNGESLTVALQPIICSDALDLQRDRPGGPPLKAVNSHPLCLSDRPPDHIDIVSVVTCTPQPEARRENQPPYREWHSRFRDTFEDAAQAAAYARHHFAAIVLSNFRTLPYDRAGGLSGVFLPVPPRYEAFHDDVVVHCYGRRGKEDPDNRWSEPRDQASANWDNRGFIAALDPFARSANNILRIFGFTIQRLPRDNSLWDKPESLARCEVTAASVDATSNLIFSKDNGHVQQRD